MPLKPEPVVPAMSFLPIGGGSPPECITQKHLKRKFYKSVLEREVRYCSGHVELEININGDKHVACIFYSEQQSDGQALGLSFADR